jgi:hypothetical protein
VIRCSIHKTMEYKDDSHGGAQVHAATYHKGMPPWLIWESVPQAAVAVVPEPLSAEPGVGAAWHRVAQFVDEYVATPGTAIATVEPSKMPPVRLFHSDLQQLVNRCTDQEIIEITPDDCAQLEDAFRSAANARQPVTVMFQDGGLKIKIGNSTWSPAMGKVVDPRG